MPELPRRVLMTADAVGGVWTYAFELSTGFANAGIEVLLCVLGGHLTSRQREQAAAIRQIRIEEHPGRLEWMHDPWHDVADAGEWLLDLAEKFQPDVVHLNGYAHGSLAWKTPVLIAAHSCVYSWFEAVRGQEPPPEWGRYRDEVRSGLNRADLVVAPSRSMLNAVARHYGTQSPGLVIHNGRSPEKFARGEKEALILTAGRLWDDAKNIALLDAYAPRLAWPVFAAGSAVAPEGGARYLTNIRALGTLDEPELAGWYARAAVFASPALYEPFGYTALEAALSGCALVLSDIESFREIWGGAAEYAPPDDPGAWVNTLNAVARDDQRRRELAANARRRALQLSSAAMVDRYLAAYADVARQQRTCESFFSVTRCDRIGTTEMPTSSAA